MSKYGNGTADKRIGLVMSELRKQCDRAVLQLVRAYVCDSVSRCSPLCTDTCCPRCRCPRADMAARRCPSGARPAHPSIRADTCTCWAGDTRPGHCSCSYSVLQHDVIKTDQGHCGSSLHSVKVKPSSARNLSRIMVCNRSVYA